MTASIEAQTGRLFLLLVLFLLSPEGGVSLELLPSLSEVQLISNSNFTVVCSGWSQVSWRLPSDSPLDGVVVDDQGSSSILQLYDATWRNSGKFVCEELSSKQTREINIFIPGLGADEWFVPVGPGVVMKEGEEGTIPCMVSDPHLNVTLYERPSRMPVTTVTFDPGHGFTGHLNDTSYVCLATRGVEERESQVYYVFSIVVPKVMEVEMTASARVLRQGEALTPKVMEVEMTASARVLRQGEALTVNCTVKDTEMVYFSWRFPRRQEIEPLTDFLSNRIRSFVNISMATLADSGVYVCAVQDTVQQQTVEKNITVTVLERGYVRLRPSSETNVSSVLHQTVELRLEVDAHPSPTVLWSKDNQTVAMETASVTTRQLMDSRYMSILTLVRVQVQQTGSYTATVSNSDEVREVAFKLEVKGQPHRPAKWSTE
ncbi:hypothetical protein LDENG_00217760 [Lucifuga dentata]|nr:hypothetical protein LDENG_00217760 [Lucifuga dentata]